LEKDAPEAPWGYYGQGLRGYNDHLLWVGSPQKLDGHISERLAQGKKSFAMDLAGPGQVLREMPLAGGLAVTLADRRTDELKGYDQEHNIATLEADILSKHSWIKITDWLKDQGSDGFDLILCNPVAGFKYFPKDENLYYYLIQKTWETLNPDGGTFYGEIPRAFLTTSVRNWARQLWSQNNIHATYSGVALELIRLPNSPDVLPTLEEQPNPNMGSPVLSASA